MTEGTGYSLADIGAMMNNRDGFDNSWWIIILLFFVWGGNGWGNNRGQSATTSDVAQGLADNRIMGKLDGISNGLCDGFYAQNTTMLQGFNSVGSQIAENRFASQQCCCETNRNIDNVRYEASKNTCDITTNATANTQKILDKLCNMEMNAKDQKIADLTALSQSQSFQLSQLAQTANVINTLRPFPQPAYITCSPYESADPYGYGYGRGRGYGFGGCGCGNF